MVFPDDIKTAKVTSIFEVNSSNDVNNYRPISISLDFSKMLERIMNNGLQKYLKDQNIPYAKQFKEFTLTVLTDLTKAFDTVN